MASPLILVAIDLTCRALEYRWAMRLLKLRIWLTCELADASQQFLCFFIFGHIACNFVDVD